MTELEMVEELFEEYDTNGDGVISRGEFVGLIECLLNERGANVSSKIFEQFDLNHDGVISKAELLVLIEDMML